MFRKSGGLPFRRALNFLLLCALVCISLESRVLTYSVHFGSFLIFFVQLVNDS